MQNEHKFDFTKKIEQVLASSSTVINKTSTIHPIVLLSFLAIGGASLGAGLGVANYLTKDYLIEDQKKATMAIETHKNEELRKNQAAAQQLQEQTKKNALLNQQKLVAEEKLAAETKKVKEERHQAYVLSQQNQYALWMKNKDALLHNYDLQINMYSTAYQLSVDNAKSQVIDLNDLDQIRDLHQDYKKDIRSMMNFVEDSLSSFNTFYQLNDDKQAKLKKYFMDYQNGSLYRPLGLEVAFIKSIKNKINERPNAKITPLRQQAADQMTIELASILSNDTEFNKIKKLKH